MRRPKAKPVTLAVHDGLEAKTIRSEVFEQAGYLTFAPVVSLITAAARLMLTLIELRVARLGGTFVFCDTDSLCVVGSELGGRVPCTSGPDRLPNGRAAVRALSWEEVRREVVAPFAALNPFDPSVVPDIVKIEAVNFGPDTQQRSVECLAISSKRYMFFTRTPEGRLQIVGASDDPGGGWQ
jgi:hypothetical protein